MTSYLCALHGCEYSDDPDLPQAVAARIGARCPECQRSADHECARLESRYQRQVDRWQRWQWSSGVPRRGLNRSLDNFKPVGRAQQQALAVMRSYAAQLPEHLRSGKGVTLLGNPGVGKTHLLYGLIAEAYKQGVLARYAVWDTVTTRTKSAFGRPGNEDASLIQQLKTCRLLVLDDLGVRELSAWEDATLTDLMDTRYREQLPTVIASNLTAESLQMVGERTHSRLLETNPTVTVGGVCRREAAGLDRNLMNSPLSFVEPDPPAATWPMSINGQIEERELAVLAGMSP